MSNSKYEEEASLKRVEFLTDKLSKNIQEYMCESSVLSDLEIIGAFSIVLTDTLANLLACGERRRKEVLNAEQILSQTNSWLDSFATYFASRFSRALKHYRAKVSDDTKKSGGQNGN